MEQIYLDTPEEQINYEFAGFWIRFVAYLIDAILLGVISGVLWLTLNDYSIVQNVFSFIIGAGYFVYFESGPSQATLGKQLMNIYVVDEQYQRIDSSKAVTRYFSKNFI